MSFASQPGTFQSASLYVGELHHEVTESVLFDLFNRVGPVASIRVCRDAITKRSLGYAYVNFHNVQDAERAIDTMNFTDIRGKACRIMWSQRDPSVRKSGVGNIFIKNLAPSFDNKGLFDLFSVFGNILSCKVATDAEGKSKGYGYIHYETAEAATDAINKLNGTTIDDYVVEVLSFVKRNDRSSQNLWTNAYIKQFPKSWDVEKFKELVAPYGEIASVAIMREADGTSKGFGFINFADHETAEKAVAGLNGTVYEENGQQFTLYIGRAQKKSERSRELQAVYAQRREEKMNLFQGRNLYVKNIDDEITDEELLKIFSDHGSVANAKIMRDTTGISKGFGFVCYNSPEDAQKAITALNGSRIRSKPLVVTLHQRKDVRRAHLLQNSNERWRFMPQGPGGMAPMPYMLVPGAQGPFPGQQRPPFFNEFPRGGPAGRGIPVRSPFYPVPPYGGMQQPGAPMNPQMQQQMKRFPNGGMPVNPAMNGGRGAPRGMPQGGRGGFPGRGAPVQQFPGRGPAGVKFNNQVRNQPVGMPQQMPQPVEAMGAMHVMPNMVQELDSNILASADPQTQKNMIGERLYPLVQQHEQQRAGKITGMLLEMEISELLNLLESPEALQSKVREALMVLEQHERSLADMKQ